jgi:hypothetical protein
MIQFFPATAFFARLGNKRELGAKLAAFVRSNTDFADIVDLASGSYPFSYLNEPAAHVIRTNDPSGIEAY